MQIPMFDIILYGAVTFLDLTAALIVFIHALSPHIKLYPRWHKIGLIVAMLGLVAQAYENIMYFVTGTPFDNTNFPLWVLKDIGVAIIVYTYLYISLKENKSK